MTELYAVYGASGCGRSLMPVARAQLKRLGLNIKEDYFKITNLAAGKKLAENFKALKKRPKQVSDS